MLVTELLWKLDRTMLSLGNKISKFKNVQAQTGVILCYRTF